MKLNRNQMKAIGADGLRKYRDERCYSQEYMANQLGITQSTYQRIEKGDIKISVERLGKIAKILNMPLEVFLKDLTTEKEIEQNDVYYQRIILDQKKLIKTLQSELQMKNELVDKLEQQLLLK